MLPMLLVVTSPFKAKFTGPHTVLKQVSEQDHIISMPGRRKSSRLCHVKLLKPYYACSAEPSTFVTQPDVVQVHRACVSGPVQPEPSLKVLVGEEDGVGIPDPVLVNGHWKNSEALCNIYNLLAHLWELRGVELAQLIQSVLCLFGDTPSCTHLIKHNIDVGDAKSLTQLI